MNKHKFFLLTCSLISIIECSSGSLVYTFSKTTISPQIADTFKQYAAIAKTKIAIDEKKQTIIATGSDTMLKELENLCMILDVHKRSINLHVDIARIKENHGVEFSLNWFGIYSKKNNNDFGFKGVGGILDYFPSPTMPITEQYGNLYVDPTKSNIFLPTDQLIVSVLTPVPGLQLPMAFGGKNLNTQRLSNFLHAFTDTDKTSVDYTLDLIAKDCERVTFQAQALLPIYATQTAKKVNDELNQSYEVTYQAQGLTITIRPRILKGDKIELAIYFKQANLINYNVNRVTGVSTSGQILTTPPKYDVFQVKQKIILRNNESFILLKTNRKDPKTTLIKIPFLDKLPLVGKLFSSQSKNNFLEEGFILITPSIID